MNAYAIKKKLLMPNPIRIAVFDDHQKFREGVVQLLERVDGVEIVGEGSTAADALKIAQESTPHVILLDVCMPGGGIEAAAAIADDCPNVRTIVLTSSESEHDVTSALQAGARGYILKGGATSEIVGAVHAVVRGDFYFTPDFAARLLIERSRRAAAVVKDTLPQPRLSRRANGCRRCVGSVHV